LASMVMAATELAEAGLVADEIMRRLVGMVPLGKMYFLPATLEYLQRGGRIGGAAALIGTALQIKPILELRNGHVEPFEKVRTHNHALERLKELVIEQCPREQTARLCIMHADELELAQQFQNDFQQALGIRDIPIYSLSASITTHAGPGTIGVGFFA
jgi:DegV family protein with EDD domain